MDQFLKIVVLFLGLCVMMVSWSWGEGAKDYEDARKNMVRDQIRARGIRDAPVLEAMGKIPRHLFIPEQYRHLAYGDRPVPIGEGQTISQPFIVALMTSELAIGPGDRVLEIGTGSGYQAAVLAELAGEVYTIEIVEPLARRARETLVSMGYTNVWVKSGDGFFGWEEHAPFDAIIVTCAAPSIPGRLVEQLKEGGRMILPLGDDPFFQSLTVITKRKDGFDKRNITGVVFVPMTGEIEKRIK